MWKRKEDLLRLLTGRKKEIDRPEMSIKNFPWKCENIPKGGGALFWADLRDEY